MATRQTDQREWRSAGRGLAVVVLVLVASLALPAGQLRLTEVGIALSLAGLLGAWHLGALARSGATWLSTLPAFGCFPVIMLLRDATGGSASGLSPLVAAPAFYLALVGSRRQLWIATLLTGLTFVLPPLLLGGPRYVAEDYRRALIWMAVIAVVGPLVRQLTSRLEEETASARRSEAQLRLVMDGAQLSSLIVTDLDGMITTFGVGAERLLGVDAAQVVGLRALGDLHAGDELAAVAHELDVAAGFEVFATLARSHADSRTWTWTRGDGSTVQVRSAVTELREEGAVVGYLEVAIDVTEAMRSRDALRDAERRWRVVMNHLPDTTLIVVDQDLTVPLISGAGAMAEKIVSRMGSPLAQVVSPDNVTILTDLARRAFDGASNHADLNSARTGHEHEVLVVPLPLESGVDEALILARDVSRIKARERALEQSRERAERMFADAPSAMVLHDTDGVVLSVNPAALRMFETTRADLVGVSLESLSRTRRDLTLGAHLATLGDPATETASGNWDLCLTSGREMYLGMTSRRLHDDLDHTDLILTHLVDLTDRRRHEQRLVHLADHDPLTGLANRRRFDAELARHLETCRRYGDEGALLMLDLDHFKRVNDTLGHAAGDELIVTVANLLTRDLRSSDTVARLGGDEFAVLLPRTTRAAAEVVVRSIVRSVREAMSGQDGPRADVSVSAGVAMVADCDGTATQLAATADLALYDAKQRGRDQFVIFEPTHAALS